jgi:Fic family protein
MVSVDIYNKPSDFEPLMPTVDGQLSELAHELSNVSIQLRAGAHPSTVDTLRQLLRQMNSYYSNLIEGNRTRPADIQRALRADYSASPERASLQRLAIAHIEAEQKMEALSTPAPLSFPFLAMCHQSLYRELSESDRTDFVGNKVEPGNFRDSQVVVGTHVPPEPNSIPDFAQRFDHVYGKTISVEQSLVAIAAAHHRATWVHPFLDGNGRSIRLQTHCALYPQTQGLWSMSRGLARHRSAYYQHLAAADQGRAGDLDGRGNLSQKALRDWCFWFLGICLDQAQFMKSMLNLDQMQLRIDSLLLFRSRTDPAYRIETSRALFHLFATGPMPRGAFLSMTGLGERTARSALAHLLKAGLVTSPTTRSPVRISFPLDSLLFLFPDLYPEATQA